MCADERFLDPGIVDKNVKETDYAAISYQRVTFGLEMASVSECCYRKRAPSRILYVVIAHGSPFGNSVCYDTIRTTR